MDAKQKFVGEGTDRIDGLLKVTGAARYSMDYPVQNAAYGILFKSTIASGRIANIDTAAAERSPGVLAVITHKNAPKLNERSGVQGGAMLQSPDVDFYGQTIGVVVAETFEQARAAARLVNVSYEKTEPKVDFEKHIGSAAPSKNEQRADVVRGNVDEAMRSAEFKVEQVYETPIEHHQPMEPHATIAVWEGPDKITLYNPSQVVNGAQNTVAAALGLDRSNVRIITPFIGGGFGSKGGMWSNIILTAVAAKMVGRPVKLALTRQQMFNSVGLRQRNRQKMRLAATKDGKLLAVAHETFTHSAIRDEFMEPCGDGSRIMYDAPNSFIAYRNVPMNIIVPTYTRGPGKTPGSFALESAVDELAYLLRMDPVEFRLKNEPAKDPSNGKPWSSRKLVECLRHGAEDFGWSRRKMEPRQVRQGGYLIGYGVGCGTYPSRQRDSSAAIRLQRDGNEVRAVVELAASDLGTGTHTILAQTAADGLGIALANVTITIGDSSLPPAAGSVGSVGAASFANAVNDACTKVTDELIAKSGKQFFVRPTAAQVMISEGISSFQSRADAKPPADANNFSSHSFNANFAEVWVNELTGTVRVRRFLTATAAGRILNPKTARSQVIGGVAWGIGQALTEESIVEPRYGNFITRTFADYHIPVHLDVGDIETIFVNEDDKEVNKMGIKGLGEVSSAGVGAAIANAVFNATGKRVRSLPITPDKLL